MITVCTLVALWTEDQNLQLQVFTLLVMESLTAIVLSVFELYSLETKKKNWEKLVICGVLNGF